MPSFSINKNSKTIFVNEYGLNNITVNFKKDEVKEFNNWILTEVLPFIRSNSNNIEENLDKYYEKDCVYIINIKIWI